MKLLITCCKFFTFFLLIFPSIFLFLHASDNFTFDYEVTHTLQSDKKLRSEYKVTVTNVTGKTYISKTQLEIPYEPQEYTATKDGASLKVISEKDDNGMYTISVSQPTIFGVGAKYTYILVITSSAPIQQKGNILDIYIPSITIGKDVKVSKYNIKISRDLPQLKFISKNLKINDITAKQEKSDPKFAYYYLDSPQNIYILMGEKVIYDFTTTLKPTNGVAFAPIPNEKQDLIVSSITSKIKDALSDSEKNLGIYIDGETQISGKIEIKSDKYNDEVQPQKYSFDDTYWKYDKRLDNVVNSAKTEVLLSNKIKRIMEYVRQTCSLNTLTSTISRVSVSKILDNPTNLNSLSISDLTATIMKASDIDVRLLAGFVDPQLKQEFQSNNLHYWLEYYDRSEKVWRSLDPTMQILSPLENYFDSTGLSHIQIFQTNTGWNVPSIDSYSIKATLTQNQISFIPNIKTDVQTDTISSGKDKSIEIILTNTGNQIANIDTINTSTDNKERESTTVKKIIYPGQQLTLDIKVKNNNYYEDKLVPVTFDIVTDIGTFHADGQVNFMKSSQVIWISVGLSSLLIVIILSVFFFNRKRIIINRKPKLIKKNHS